MTMASPAEAPAIPGIATGKIGVWWFLASEIMLFGGLIASYSVFRLGGPGWAEAAHHLSVPLASINTLVLLTSSYTVVRAFVAAERGDVRALRVYLGLTILGGLIFLGIKAVEYTTEIRAGFPPAAGIFWSFYYTMTGLHALHVLAGVVVNSIVLATEGVGAKNPHRVELAGLYWHFVDVVWIFLFPLLYLL
ncbi:MAG: cytochrome c oxidase subunit 3 [Candidatus Rokubacteria bacterium]|nr:cytochrome c oxidase subunit 3 [Candidatus Rokubacteria bacterium]